MSDTYSEIEQQVLESPAARARLLAQALEVMEQDKSGAMAESYESLLSADLRDGKAFLGTLAASTVVIAIASAGERGSIAGGLGTKASTVVIAIASAGERGSIAGGLGTKASTVVIAIASAGERGSLGAMRGGLEANTQVASPAQIAAALRQLADLVEAGGAISTSPEDELRRMAEEMVADATSMTQSAQEMATSAQEMHSSAKELAAGQPSDTGGAKS